MTDLELHPDLTPAPTTLFASDDPDVIVARATRIADVLAPVISDRHLYAPIRSKKYPTLEAWTLLGGLMPVMVSPHVVRTWQTEDGWGAHAEARTLEGRVVSAADAYCMRDEDDWARKPHHQLASMASTRACSRAMRLPLSFVMSLTGYEVTPAEEMEAAARGETVSGGRGVRPGWRDINEQNQAHSRLNVFLANNGLGEWVARWLDSKGYPRPLSKPQMSELRRAVDRELADRDDEQSGVGSNPAGSGDVPPGSPTPDPKSPSAREPEVTPTQADRSRADGANQDGTTVAGAGDPPSPGAADPPDGAGEDRPQPPGGSSRSRPADRPRPGGRGATAGRDSEQPPLDGDPGRFTR